MAKRVYLDHAAATPVDPAVLRAMEPYFGIKFGNPGSLHSFGQEAIAAVDAARERIAKELGAAFRGIIFTSSATEANNLVLRGAVAAAAANAATGATGKSVRPRIIISAVEHESVLETARVMADAGVAELIIVPVDAEGFIDLKKMKESLTPETAVVSVIYAQNEIGTIQPIAEVARMVRSVRGSGRRPLFHTDAAQALQFLDCRPEKIGVDAMTLSSHKIYGPKGAGALYVKEGTDLLPMTTGGGQEFGLRSGTENVPAIVGFAEALAMATALRAEESARLAVLKDELWHGIRRHVPSAGLNGTEDAAKKLPNILNVYFPGHKAGELLTRFDLEGLAASSGSACRSRAADASHVIGSLGHPEERAHSSIRFSLGKPTTKEDVSAAIEIIRRSVGGIH